MFDLKKETIKKNIFLGLCIIFCTLTAKSNSGKYKMIAEINLGA